MYYKALFSICLFTCTWAHAASYWEGSMIQSYVHASDLQRRWAWVFLAPHLKDARSDAKVLDIGCGDGKVTADIAHFVPDGSVEGIDISSAMISWAKKQYHYLEYPNLSFREGSFLDIGTEEKYDLVVSFCALQHCHDKEAAVQEIARVLKPGGKLLILIPSLANPAFTHALRKMQTDPKWESYWEGYVSLQFLGEEQYKSLLEEAGYHVLSAKSVKTMDPFIDREEFVRWFMGTFPPIIPKDSQEQYYNELIDEYLCQDPDSIDSDGTIYAKLGLIEVVAERQ